MKIAILGATGATGQEIIRQALERSYQITALVRNSTAIQQTNENLEVISGNIFDADTLEKMIAGKDAVVSVLGSKRGDAAPTIYSESAKSLIAAMNKTGSRRLIYCTSAGTEDHDPGEMLFYHYIIKPFFLQKSYNDMKAAEALIRQTDLDWILVRPALLTNGSETEHFRVSPRFRSKGGTRISRADVAYFMLEQVTSNEWVHKTPTLTY